MAEMVTVDGGGYIEANRLRNALGALNGPSNGLRRRGAPAAVTTRIPRHTKQVFYAIESAFKAGPDGEVGRYAAREQHSTTWFPSRGGRVRVRLQSQ